MCNERGMQGECGRREGGEEQRGAGVCDFFLPSFLSFSREGNTVTRFLVKWDLICVQLPISWRIDFHLTKSSRVAAATGGSRCISRLRRVAPRALRKRTEEGRDLVESGHWSSVLVADRPTRLCLRPPLPPRPRWPIASQANAQTYVDKKTPSASSPPVLVLFSFASPRPWTSRPSSPASARRATHSLLELCASPACFCSIY